MYTNSFFVELYCHYIVPSQSVMYSPVKNFESWKNVTKCFFLKKYSFSEIIKISILMLDTSPLLLRSATLGKMLCFNFDKYIIIIT